jgi:hypothetical protein
VLENDNEENWSVAWTAWNAAERAAESGWNAAESAKSAESAAWSAKRSAESAAKSAVCEAGNAAYTKNRLIKSRNGCIIPVCEARYVVYTKTLKKCHDFVIKRKFINGYDIT